MPPTPATSHPAQHRRPSHTPAEGTGHRPAPAGRRTPWRTPSRPRRAVPPRDLALDAVRGLAVCLAVINHMPTMSLYQWLSVERLGVVTGAELLVIVSGVVLGAVHRRRIAERGWRASADALWGRSLQLYRVAVAVVLAVWGLGLAGVHPPTLTGWTDPGTGVVYRLIPAPSADAVRDLLLLRISPWQVNVLGLYVVLTAAAPAALWLLVRRRARLLVLASWALYLASSWLRPHVTGAAFEGPFPLLTWQLPFVHALVVGYHRGELGAVLAGAPRRRLLAGAGALAAAFAFLAWNSPWTGAPAWTRLSLIAPRDYALVYAALVGNRSWLAPGRLVDAALVVYVLHAALGRWWAAAWRAAGWFLVPIGQASLYVFVVHLAGLWLVASLPRPALAPRPALLLETLVHTAVLLLLWAAVRARFLFRWIPR